MGRRVPGAGPQTARVVLVGEAPGEHEEREGVPFVGASGEFLFHATRQGRQDVDALVWPGLTRLGLGRDRVRLENVIEVRPPENDLDAVSLAAMRQARASLRRRIAALDATVVVPLGNCALNALLETPLTQRKRRGGGASWKWPATISTWRGSVNPIMVEGRAVTMIPTFHPAAFLWRDGQNFQAWRSDWAKIVAAGEEGATITPTLTHHIGPTWETLTRFERLVQHTWHRQGAAALLAVDIETIGPMIDCIGFCVDGETTVTIPLLPSLWPGKHADVRKAWGVAERLLRHPIPKGTWWGYYDLFRLERQRGIRVRNWRWDGYNLHHLLDPADEHSLAYVTSRLLRVPFWKHESTGDKKKAVSKALQRDWRMRHTYNGKDVGYTWHDIRILAAQVAGEWEPPWAMIG